MISAYHQKWMKKTDEQIAHMVSVKEQMWREILAKLPTNTFGTKPSLKIAILGCKEKRMVELHRQMFERLLHRPVEQWTFDIVIEHLEGADRIVQQDISKPLAHASFDVLFGDVVIRFLDGNAQLQALKNAFDALSPGGIAVFMFASEDRHPSPEYEPKDGVYRVDFPYLCDQMSQMGVSFQLIEHRFETRAPGVKELIVIDDTSLVLRK